MEHIWQEMARDIMFVYGDLINMTEDKLVRVLSDAWGDDRAAAVWKLEDVLSAAEYYEVEITTEEARGLMHQLVGHLESYNGEEVLADLIEELEDNYDSNDE